MCLWALRGPAEKPLLPGRGKKCCLCLLDRLIQCLEQNFQKLRGILDWEAPAGAVGEGSIARLWEGNGMETQTPAVAATLVAWPWNYPR